MKQRQAGIKWLKTDIAIFGQRKVECFMINKDRNLLGRNIKGAGYEVDLLFFDEKTKTLEIVEVKTRTVVSEHVIHETLDFLRPTLHKKVKNLKRAVDDIVNHETFRYKIRFFFVFIFPERRGAGRRGGFKSRLIELSLSVLY